MASPTARGRMIRRSISESKKIASLSPEAAVLFVMLIPHLNAHGKMPGGPGVVKDEVVPLIPYISYETTPGLLREISEKTNLKWFRQGARWWIHALDFHDHQDLRADKLGSDDLPSWVEVEESLSDEPEVAEIVKFREWSGSGPGVVRDFPSRAEGLKVRREEEEPKTQQQRADAREPTRAEEAFERCWDENEEKIRRLFPGVDFPVERAKCVAHYRLRAPPVDPLLTVMKWCERSRKDGPAKKEKPQRKRLRDELAEILGGDDGTGGMGEKDGAGGFWPALPAESLRQAGDTRGSAG